jgi:transposase
MWGKPNIKKETTMNDYDHYIALDWAQHNMAIARLTNGSSKIKTIDVPVDIENLKLHLKRLKGRRILTFEETTTSQWLYTELRDLVEDIVICDPYRNRLLSDGPKTDRIDAEKLAQLLKAGLLKAVYHSGNRFIDLRKLVSGYEDLVKSGVRLKNQRSALLRGQGKDKKEKSLDHPIDCFVLKDLDNGITVYESRKNKYEQAIKKSVKQHREISSLDSIPGIGPIGAVKIAAIVVDPRRFQEKGRWLSFCGLIKHEKISGGRSYGRRKSRYCRTLKSVFKTAALSVIRGQSNHWLRDYYEYLIHEKRYPEYQARHALARKIAIVTLGVFKSGKQFDLRRQTANTKKI